MTTRAAALAVNPAASTALRGTRGFFKRTPWVFTYFDVKQQFEVNSPEVKLFLGTNLGFAISGAAVGTFGGDPALGLLSEMAGGASLLYHSQQCFRGGTERPAVQLAMAIDYLFALPSLGLGLQYALALPADARPESGIALAVSSFLCLLGGWVCTEPIEYLVTHGLWHVFACAAAYQFALAHSAAAILG